MVLQNNIVRHAAHNAEAHRGDSAFFNTNGIRSGLALSTRRGWVEADAPHQSAVGDHGGDPIPFPRYRSILVPLDGSVFAEHALPMALAIAQRTGARLRIAHVFSALDSLYEPIEISINSGLNYWRKEQKQIYLDTMRRRLAKVTPARTMSRLLVGRDVASSIKAEADGWADLVVMATHKRTPLDWWWNGSTTESLLGELSAPMLLVPGQKTPPDLAFMPPAQRILIALDESESVERVLEPMVALGDLMGSEITLLRIVRQAPDFLLWSNARRWQPYIDAKHEEARQRFHRRASRLSERIRSVHTHAVRDDRSIAKAIISHAQNRDVDLIALATRRRGGLSRLFRRSVAARVIQRASVPVFVVSSGGNYQRGHFEERNAA
jgi:nucleotide-binding universal stress UspA family protein